MAYYNRKNPRIPHYDYTTNNFYFITICTHEKECLFWSNGALNPMGVIARDLLLDIPNHANGVYIDNCVVIPNHIHAIVMIDAKDAQKVRSLSQIVSQYKSAVSRKIHTFLPEKKLWQRSFHDHVIRNQKSYEKIWTYIQYNPEQWAEDCFHPDWNEP